MLKKSIVLSDVENTNKKAVLSLEEDGQGVCGTLRLYNFPHEPNGVLSLGLYSGNQVFKAGLTKKSQMFYQFFISLKNIPNKFSCAIVNFQNAVVKPLLFGSSEGSQDDIFGSIITELSTENSLENTKNVLDKYGVDFQEEEKRQVEQEIDSALCDARCANCIYKNHFYKDEPVQAESLLEKEAKAEPQETKSEEKPELEFFDRLKPQIDKLFENNPAENALQELFPASKWVKVEYEDEGDFFVFGLLYDEAGEVKYVCYGVPSVFDENPPEELDGYPIWLPLDDEKGFGYWMTYQDASTGEPVKAIID